MYCRCSGALIHTPGESGDESKTEIRCSTRCFKFADQIFHQISGLAMGSSVSGILAILFMNSIENQALTTFTEISCYSRYVDDIFVLVRDRAASEQLLQTMNAVHPNIQFEIELPSTENSLSLLDLTVTVGPQGESNFEFYKKPARSEVFMNGRTALPASTIRNVIMNEQLRIIERCTSPNDANQHLQAFQEILLHNDHRPIHNNRLARPKTTNRKRISHDNTFFIHLPFISDRIDRSIRRVFKNAKLEVIPYYQNKNLRSVLTKRDNQETCNITNCPIQNPRLCTRKNVVYEVRCITCQAKYIGSTIRPLHQRIREHLQQTTSAVFQHLSSCPGTQGISVRILANEKDPKNLRIKEGILIEELNPNLNKKEEEVALISLVKLVS